MRKLFFPLIASLFALIDGPEPPLATPAPVVAFRTRLVVGDDDRNWTYVTNFDGTLDPVWTVNGKPYQPFSLPAVNLWYDAAYSGGVTVTQPGTITVDCGQPVTLTAVAAPARMPFTIPTVATALYVQNCIRQAQAKGLAPDLILQSGEHTWDRMVTLPDNARVTGRGAFIKRTLTIPVGDKYPCFYIGGQDVSIYGLQFVDVPGGAVLFTNDPPATPGGPARPSSGLVLSRCTFKGCNLGFYHTGALVQKCVFEGGGAIIAPSGLFWQCVFIGPSVSDQFQGWAGLGQFQQIDCHYIRSPRGPVFNAIGQSIESPFFSGVECHDIVRGNNGNECWLCEGGACNNLLAFHCRLRGCDSVAFQLDRGGSGCLVRDFVQDGGVGILLNPAPPATISGFTLQDFELKRCGIYCVPGVSATFKDGTVVDWQPTRGNQTFANQAPPLLGRTAAIVAGPGVTMTNVAQPAR